MVCTTEKELMKNYDLSRRGMNDNTLIHTQIKPEKKVRYVAKIKI